MRILDLHADLALLVRHARQDGLVGEECRSVLKDFWGGKFAAGEITWTAAASFFFGKENWAQMQETVKSVKADILAGGGQIILTADELNEHQTGTAFIMTIEGMCGIDRDAAERVRWLYDEGNRIGSLCWSEQNALATGVDGDPARGVTALGREALREMNRLHMVVDVSHANEKTFWDLFELSETPVIATHSNAKRLCFAERNLTDQQIKALAGRGGIIGMNAWSDFIHEDPAQRSAEMLARHAAYIAELVGVEHVACGFDFDVFGGEGHPNSDIDGTDLAQNFIRGLEKVGFSEKEIEQIAYGNSFAFLKKWM